MPAKKRTAAKETSESLSKRAPKSSYKFPCPNRSGKPTSLEALVRRMRKDEEFAEFIRDLLCDANGGDKEKAKAARDCLDSYYTVTGEDLTALCLPQSFLFARCTVPTKYVLIAVPATALARGRRR